MSTQNEIKMIKRLNTTLSDTLALYVGTITGEGKDFKTPSDFINYIIRRHKERTEAKEEREITAMLTQSLIENDYAEWSEEDLQEARDLAEAK